jgi:hypothetical protein
MCTPAALETLLRGTLRKVGVDCVAIAVDASSFTGGGDTVDCSNKEPTLTRIAELIQNGRVNVNLATAGTPQQADTDCEGLLIEGAINELLIPSFEDPYVTIMEIFSVAGESECPEACEDDGVGLQERFMGSVRVIEEDGVLRLLVVTAASGDQLDCDDVTPTETLLRSAFVRQSDGGWAMRILLEA